jgi:ATP-dependent helicase/nuclease subunit B
VCPMKAHLRYRLGLAVLEPASRGLTAGERGGILHQALQFLFTRIRSSDALAALDSSAAHNVANDAAKAAVNDIRDVVRDRVGLPALDLEVTRLTRALVDWLTIERERTVPFEVEFTEEPLDWHCEGLTLGLKADRVDRLACGHRVVIDYKSGGSSRVSDWCEIPLKAPQLPCYSQALSDVVTITIAKVGAEDVGFNTLGDDIGVLVTDRKSQKALLSADVSSLSELSNQWTEALTSLVQSFVAGEAVPTPSASACRYCDYAPVCRAHLLESVAQTGSASDE